MPDEPLADWRGETYDRISGPHAAMGAPALERLELVGEERVLDAGCGSGRLTERLLERSPHGHVIALDGSASMLAEAKRRLARFGDRVTYVQADLARPPLPVDGPVDAILSTAAFHWITDHDALFEGLAGVLRSGGQLSAQCGGKGNGEAVFEATRMEGVDVGQVFHMADVDETRERLERFGFVEARVWLQPQTIEFDAREDMLEYIVTPFLRPATGLPEAELFRLAEVIADRLGRMAIDYVRLNILARKA